MEHGLEANKKKVRKKFHSDTQTGIFLLCFKNTVFDKTNKDGGYKGSAKMIGGVCTAICSSWYTFLSNKSCISSIFDYIMK